MGALGGGARQSNCEGDDGVMQTVEPSIGTTRLWVKGGKARARDWDPIRGLHQARGYGAAQKRRT